MNKYILNDKKKEYILKLTPKDKDKTFKYLKVWVQKNPLVTTKTQYINDSDLVYKVLTAENIKTIDTHVVPLKVSMKEISTQKTTVYEIDEDSLEYDINISDKVFSERNLKK